MSFHTTAAAVGAGGGFLGDLAMTGISAGINAAAASKAHDRQKNMMTRGPTYIMEGLRAAGINPILAAGSGGFGGSSAKVSMADAPRGSTAAVQGALAGSQMQLQGAATAKALAEKNIIQAGQPAADWQAAYYNTPAGQDLLLKGLRNKALPSTASGALIRWWEEGEGKMPKPDSSRWPKYKGPSGKRSPTEWWKDNYRKQNKQLKKLLPYFVDDDDNWR